MIQDSIILILTGFILLLPLVFWMYIFVSFFEHNISRKQFIFGILAGGLTSLPLVYRDTFYLGGTIENIFFNLSVGSSNLFSFSLLYYLLLFFIIIWLLWGCISYFFQSNVRSFLRIQILSLGAFFILLIGGVFYIDVFTHFFKQMIPGVGVVFGDFVFISVGSIFGYYIITSLLEEGGKYISSLSFSGKGKYFKVFPVYICMSACIALGFSFFENILYTHSYLSQEGISWSLVQIVFFRSIFSVILHLVASILFALAFWHVFSCFKISKFIIFSILAVGSHVLFDVSLSFGYLAIMFIYIIFIYVLLTYVTTQSGHSSSE